MCIRDSYGPKYMYTSQIHSEILESMVSLTSLRDLFNDLSILVCVYICKIENCPYTYCECISCMNSLFLLHPLKQHNCVQCKHSRCLLYDGYITFPATSLPLCP